MNGYRDAHLAWMVALVGHDKNHAAVIFWSLGNEAGNGKPFLIFKTGKKRDTICPYNMKQAHQKDQNTDHYYLFNFLNALDIMVQKRVIAFRYDSFSEVSTLPRLPGICISH
ncbi:glycoside hydrolase family 2 TIM barrel-domain containing protein [Pedobacter sp. MR22-3]|uniref:glycoside hydrolase family 2 TIM barrel-domain containing protein n=1 Tax=Pedobacter sp. MR22-3 TaxID=2994552 RepID=UPI003A598BB9